MRVEAGGNWPERARHAALAMNAAREGDAGAIVPLSRGSVMVKHDERPNWPPICRQGSWEGRRRCTDPGDGRVRPGEGRAGGANDSVPEMHGPRVVGLAGNGVTSPGTVKEYDRLTAPLN